MNNAFSCNKTKPFKVCYFINRCIVANSITIFFYFLYMNIHYSFIVVSNHANQKDSIILHIFYNWELHFPTIWLSLWNYFLHQSPIKRGLYPRNDWPTEIIYTTVIVLSAPLLTQWCQWPFIKLLHHGMLLLLLKKSQPTTIFFFK